MLLSVPLRVAGVGVSAVRMAVRFKRGERAG
jgi:hypothetical protein